jgi:hypothetical protein
VLIVDINRQYFLSFPTASTYSFHLAFQQH